MSETNFMSTGDVTLHVALDGVTDALPLVFINSLGTDLRIWDRVVPYLANPYYLIRYDKRGHGLSDSPSGPGILRNFTDDLAGLLTALKINEAVLIGDSVGGMIALDFAISRPQRVKALVLCDTAAKIGTANYWHERIEALRQDGLAPLADGILSRWFSPTFPTQYPAAYRGYGHMLTRTPLEGYIATCEAIKDADLRAEVQTIDIEALVLCGSDDGATPPALVRELAAALPKARFELIEGAGHIPSLEQPEILAQKIDNFLHEHKYGSSREATVLSKAR